jgi:hypothetical protein
LTSAVTVVARCRGVTAGPGCSLASVTWPGARSGLAFRVTGGWGRRGPDRVLIRAGGCR